MIDGILKEPEVFFPISFSLFYPVIVVRTNTDLLAYSNALSLNSFVDFIDVYLLNRQGFLQRNSLGHWLQSEQIHERSILDLVSLSPYFKALCGAHM